MATKRRYPQVVGAGILTRVISQLRRSFPTVVNVSTLQKLSLAPKNESTVLGVLRFLGLVDEAGNRTSAAAEVFLEQDDSAFAEKLSKVMKIAYAELFELYGDAAWTLEQSALIGFFRKADATTAITGERQALAFKTLAALTGHGEMPATASRPRRTEPRERSPKIEPQRAAAATPPPPEHLAVRSPHPEFGFTVRIEVNLPPLGDQEKYDQIFRSIREHLLNER